MLYLSPLFFKMITIDWLVSDLSISFTSYTSIARIAKGKYWVIDLVFLLYGVVINIFICINSKSFCSWLNLISRSVSECYYTL